MFIGYSEEDIESAASGSAASYLEAYQEPSAIQRAPMETEYVGSRSW